MALSCSNFAMRCVRRPITPSSVQKSTQRCQRAYGVQPTAATYHKVLIDSPIIRKFYFNSKRLSSDNDYEDTFYIDTHLLRTMMIDAKNSNQLCAKKIMTSYVANIFESLDKEVKESQGPDVSLRVSDSKVSLFLLMWHVSWNGVMHSDKLVYPERHMFPVLLNNKEEILTFANKIHSKSEMVNGVVISNERISMNQEALQMTVEVYERLFTKKGL